MIRIIGVTAPRRLARLPCKWWTPILRRQCLLSRKITKSSPSGPSNELATRPRPDQSERFVERRVSRVLHRQPTRQRFLQRQKIPPGKALLQRAAQQKGRMKRGQGADFAPPGVVGKPASTRTRNPILDAEQRLHCWPTKTDQNIGIGELDLPADEWQADCSLLWCRRAVARRPPWHDIGDVGRRAVETDRRHHAVEQFAGTSDERPADNIFIVARRLADEHDAALRIAVGKD